MIYEILYIIPSKFSDSEIDGVRDQIAKRLEAAGAKVEKTENLGKLKLAYPIKKVSHGTYILTFVEAEADKLGKIDQDLRLSDEVLRHVIVKRPEGVPEQVATPSSYQAPLTPEGKRTTGAAGRKEAPKPEPVKKVVPAAEKMSDKEIDEKLDKILDDSDLNV